MTTPIKTLAARIAFVLLVALPTCGTLGYLASASLQSVEMSAKAWSSLLSERTGLEIQIGKMEQLASGEFLLEEFEVGDPESGAIWVSVPSVTAQLDENGLIMRASGAALRASALQKFIEHLEQRVLKARRSGFVSIAFVAEDCLLVLSEKDRSPLSIPELSLTTRMESDRPEMHIAGKIIEDGAVAAVSLDSWRIRLAGKPSTIHQWKIDGEVGLSTGTLAEFSPKWSKLGPNAKFRGKIEFDSEKSDYLLSAIQIDEIDLSICGESLGLEAMSGFASIDGERAGENELGAKVSVENGKFTELFGELRIQAGKSDAVFFDRLRQTIGLEVAESLNSTRAIDFDEFAIRVDLLDDQLRFQGVLDKYGLVMERQGKDIARISNRFTRRNARFVLASLFSEVHSESLFTSQWIAAMPEASSNSSPAASTARKNSKMR